VTRSSQTIRRPCRHHEVRACDHAVMHMRHPRIENLSFR
jgi:hypothetical protein